MIKKALAALACAAITAGASAAVSFDSITYDDRTKVAAQELVLNGAGLRKKLFFKVYTAGLYLPGKAASAKDAIAMKGAARVRLGLMRDVSASSFVGALVDGIKDNTPEPARKAIAKEVDALIAVMNRIGDVKTGDIVDFDFDPSTGTAVSLNGKSVGTRIGSRALFNAVLGIWLGENAIDSDLKKAMVP